MIMNCACANAVLCMCTVRINGIFCKCGFNTTRFIVFAHSFVVLSSATQVPKSKIIFLFIVCTNLYILNAVRCPYVRTNVRSFVRP